MVLTELLHLESDDVHFRIANETLHQGVLENSSLIDTLEFSESDVDSLENGQTPEGFTCHHHENPGVLQLVNEEAHSQTANTGGKALWGVGTEFR